MKYVGSVICGFASVINIPFFPNPFNIISFGFCSAMALITYFMVKNI